MNKIRKDWGNGKKIVQLVEKFNRIFGKFVGEVCHLFHALILHIPGLFDVLIPKMLFILGADKYKNAS